MKIHVVSTHSGWDDREVLSVHMTRKGALQVACDHAIETLGQYDCWDDSDTIWIADNDRYHNDANLTIKCLEGIFKYAEQLLWQVEIEVQITSYTLQP